MGMSASQARYLQLTARKSNLEYQVQQITQARLSLSNSTEQVTAAYNEAISNRRLYFVAVLGDPNPPVLNYYNIVNPVDEGGMGMQLLDALGNIIVPELPAEIEEGKHLKDYVIDPDLKNPEYLDECLRNNVYFLGAKKVSEKTGKWEWQIIDYTTCDYISDQLYTDDDAIATAKYEAEISKIQQQDKTLELNLQQLETERNSIQSELDAVKKVIDDSTNVFRQTFNHGGS